MKLIINKFPPITGRCEIDLSKKLTLFVGHNNSGKTYISQLIWGIYDINVAEYLGNNLTQTEPIWDGKDTLISFTEKHLVNLSNKIGLALKLKIQHIFKYEIDYDYSIEITQEEIMNLKINLDRPYGVGFKISKQKGSMEFKLQVLDKEDEFLFNKSETFEAVLISELLQESLFLPSSRLFFPSFYKYIFNTEKNFKDDMYKNLEKLDDKNKKFYAPSYTQPVDDLIQKLIFSLDKPLDTNQYLEKLAKIIEGNISVDRAEAIAMADISYNHKSGENIPMYLSSSMVNQLSTLYLYFKYWMEKKDNFLIIDEPEMNLHPAKKIEVLELLMHFASENKLLMATHSNTLAKSIINYLHLFDLRDKGVDTKAFIEENELEMDSEINLSSNDIGIYYFNGKTIVPYKYDNDSNIHFGTFSEVEELQSMQFEYIMDELESNDA